MKKLVSIIVAVLMLVLVLGGCSVLGGEPVLPESDVPPADAPADADEPADAVLPEGIELSPRFQLWYDALCITNGKSHAVYRAQAQDGSWVEMVVGGYNAAGLTEGDSLFYTGLADGSYLAMSINGTAYVLLADQKLAVTTDKIDTSKVSVPGSTSDVKPVTAYTTGTETLNGEELEYDEMTCTMDGREALMRVYVAAGTDTLRYVATQKDGNWYYLEIVSYGPDIPEQFTKLPEDYTVMDAAALGGLIDPDALSSFDLEGLNLDGLNLEGLDLSGLDLGSLDLEGLDIGDIDLGGLGIGD